MSQEAIANHRRMRLLQWMERYDINRTELAKRLKVGRAYVSLLLIERKPEDTQKSRHFGEKTARSIEANLGMPRGYLDGDTVGNVAPIANWELVRDLPATGYALVPRVDLAIVDSTLTAESVDLPALAFTRLWLESRRVQTRDTLRTMEVLGDSMTEYLQSGDIALIDMAQQHVEDRGIYAIRFADELRIKRLERTFSGGLRIISDNLTYKTEELSPEQAAKIAILGRVIYRQG